MSLEFRDNILQLLLGMLFLFVFVCRMQNWLLLLVFLCDSHGHRASVRFKGRQRSSDISVTNETGDGE